MKRFAAAIAVFLMTACGSVHTLSSSSPSAPPPNQAAAPTPRSSVPWLPLPAAHQFVNAPFATPLPPIPIPAGTPVCQPSQLEGESWGEGAAAGNVDMPLLFRNRSTTNCWLEGYLGISILDAHGTLLATSMGSDHLGTFFADGPVTPIMLLAGTPRLVPITGPMSGDRGVRGQAWMNMSWYDCLSPRASRLSVELPAGGRFSIPFTLVGDENPACYPGSTARPAVFRGPLSPGGMPWPPQLLYLKDSISIDAPATARVGSTLVLFVTITDDDATTYQMLPCADYSVGLEPKERLDERQLNCSPAGKIGPAASATFEIRVEVPASTVPGAYELWWILADGRLESPTATTNITIS